MADGTPIEELFAGPGVDPAGSLLVPDGFLADFAPGDLLGLRATASGLRIEHVDAVGTPPEHLTGLIAAMLDVNGATVPATVDEVIYRLCIAEPDLFADPLPPIAMLFDSWGLDHDAEHVAPAGFDFGSWKFGSQVRRLAIEYQIDDDQALAVAALSTVFADVLRMVESESFDPDAVGSTSVTGDNGFATGDSPVEFETAGQLAEFVGELLPQLAESAVAEAFFWETVGEGVKEAVALGALVLPNWMCRRPTNPT